jgi:hypothetical protein
MSERNGIMEKKASTYVTRDRLVSRLRSQVGPGSMDGWSDNPGTELLSRGDAASILLLIEEFTGSERRLLCEALAMFMAGNTLPLEEAVSVDRLLVRFEEPTAPAAAPPEARAVGTRGEDLQVRSGRLGTFIVSKSRGALRWWAVPTVLRGQSQTGYTLVGATDANDKMVYLKGQSQTGYTLVGATDANDATVCLKGARVEGYTPRIELWKDTPDNPWEIEVVPLDTMDWMPPKAED